MAQTSSSRVHMTMKRPHTSRPICTSRCCSDQTMMAGSERKTLVTSLTMAMQRTICTLVGARARARVRVRV